MLSSAFLFSFPSTYFHPITAGFAAFFLPKCSGVKSAEESALLWESWSLLSCTIRGRGGGWGTEERKESGGRTVLKPSTGYQCSCQPHVWVLLMSEELHFLSSLLDLLTTPNLSAWHITDLQTSQAFSRLRSTDTQLTHTWTSMKWHEVIHPEFRGDFRITM